MNHDRQFFLEVKDGEKIAETGFFFRAAPFDIQVGEASYHCCFAHTDQREVVVNLKTNERTLGAFEYPFYGPEVEPQDAATSLAIDQATGKAIFHALVSLEVTKDPRYVAYFVAESSEKPSYQVNQQPLIA